MFGAAAAAFFTLAAGALTACGATLFATLGAVLGCAAAGRAAAPGTFLRNRFLLLLHARIEHGEGFVEASVDLGALVLRRRRAAARPAATRAAGGRRAACPATGSAAAGVRTLARTAGRSRRAAGAGSTRAAGCAAVAARAGRARRTTLTSRRPLSARGSRLAGVGLAAR